jgi:hypothetical protein
MWQTWRLAYKESLWCQPSRKHIRLSPDLHVDSSCGALYWGWPAILRLALHGGKVSKFFSNSGVQFSGPILQNRICRTQGPPNDDGRHPFQGFAPPVSRFKPQVVAFKRSAPILVQVLVPA